MGRALHGAGVVLGKLIPSAIAGLRSVEFGKASQINAPIAVLIWIMITPMMMKVDFSSVRNVGKRPAGLLVTLFINWVVKPFSMALFASAFFRVIFAPEDGNSCLWARHIDRLTGRPIGEEFVVQHLHGRVTFGHGGWMAAHGQIGLALVDTTSNVWTMSQ